MFSNIMIIMYDKIHHWILIQVKPLPLNLTLPIPWSLNKNDPILKESRRKGLDAYLQVLLNDDKLIKNPQSFEMIVKFLSDSYTRDNQFINRKVCRTPCYCLAFHWIKFVMTFWKVSKIEINKPQDLFTVQSFFNFFKWVIGKFQNLTFKNFQLCSI